jgi:fructose-1-phosphate kinase PfkB-like protein
MLLDQHKDWKLDDERFPELMLKLGVGASLATVTTWGTQLGAPDRIKKFAEKVKVSRIL